MYSNESTQSSSSWTLENETGFYALGGHRWQVQKQECEWPAKQNPRGLGSREDCPGIQAFRGDSVLLSLQSRIRHKPSGSLPHLAAPSLHQLHSENHHGWLLTTMDSSQGVPEDIRGCQRLVFPLSDHKLMVSLFSLSCPGSEPRSRFQNSHVPPPQIQLLIKVWNSLYCPPFPQHTPLTVLLSFLESVSCQARPWDPWVSRPHRFPVSDSVPGYRAWLTADAWARLVEGIWPSQLFCSICFFPCFIFLPTPLSFN